jgi:Cu/Ag efflux pump CusA
MEAGQRRFRAVLLTSLTTVAGLTPMLLERSFQGQILVPMATSLAFGIMCSTALVLVLVPAMYVIYARLLGDRSTFDAAPLLGELESPAGTGEAAPVAEVELIPR